MRQNTKKGCSSERDRGSPSSPRTHIGCFLHELEIHIVNVVRLLDYDQPFDYQHKYLRNSRSKNIFMFFYLYKYISCTYFITCIYIVKEKQVN